MKYPCVAVLVLSLCGMVSAQPMAGPFREHPAKVLIIPFRILSVDTSGDVDDGALSASVQETLMTELRRDEKIKPIVISGSDAKLNFDVDAAVRQAKSQEAATVVFGSIQRADRQVRILGSVVDVESGRTLGVLKATGDSRDVFELEDILSRQAHRILMPAAIVAPVVVIPQPTTQPAYVDPGPIRNPYAMHTEDPAVVRSRNLLQSSADFVYPYYGCGGYYGGGGFYYGGYSGFGYSTYSR
jgi:TolB-like protein